MKELTEKLFYRDLTREQAIDALEGLGLEVERHEDYVEISQVFINDELLNNFVAMLELQEKLCNS